jgi:hypothetical protein
LTKRFNCIDYSALTVYEATNRKGAYKMFEVTEKAVEMIQDFLKDRSEEHVIRITMNEGG